MLHAKRPLTAAEWNGTRDRAGLLQHPEKGVAFLRDLAGHRRLQQAIYDVCGCHHERWDGRGYPRGLAGEAITRPVRLCAILDAYDSMTFLRGYRGVALSPAEALAEIERGAGTQFDPTLVRAIVPILSYCGALPQYERLNVPSA